MSASKATPRVVPHQKSISFGLKRRPPHLGRIWQESRVRSLDVLTTIETPIPVQQRMGARLLVLLSIQLRCGDSDRDGRLRRFRTADRGKARGAVDGVTVARNERHGRQLLALGTGDFRLGTIGQAKLGLSRRPAVRTSGGNIDQFLRPEKMLFTSRPGERFAAIATRQRLVSKLHEKPLHKSGTRWAPPQPSSMPKTLSHDPRPETSSTTRFLDTVAPQKSYCNRIRMAVQDIL